MLVEPTVRQIYIHIHVNVIDNDIDIDIDNDTNININTPYQGRMAGIVSRWLDLINSWSIVTQR